MTPDQLTLFILVVAFIAFSFHVTLDNALALIRWVRNSRTSVSYRHISPNLLTRKLARS